MKPIIVIIEDETTDIDKLRRILQGYDFFPSTQKKDLDFFEQVKNSIDNSLFGIGDVKRKNAFEDVKQRLLEIQNNVVAYIVDYQLREGREDLTGINFYHNMIKILSPIKPCLMITHLTSSNILNQIIEYVDQINNRNKLTFRLKNFDDVHFETNIKNFIDDANPVIKLCKCILEKDIEQTELLRITMKDIINNWQMFNYENLIKGLENLKNHYGVIKKKELKRYLEMINGAKKND